MNAILAGVLVYVIAQLIVGIVVSRRLTTEADYFLAGRRLGFGLATMTIFATWFGAETCVGSSGEIYDSGLSGGTADPFGYTLCLLLMGLVFAVRFWKCNLTTLGDLFRIRYSPLVEKIAVLVIVPTSVIWAAAQIRAFGHVLDVSSQMGNFLSITLAAGVVIVYTVAGGLFADAITDFIQGIALVVGLIVLLIVAFVRLPEMHVLAESFTPDRLNPFAGDDISILEHVEYWAVPILGSVVAQELISRTLASRTPTIARNATLTAAGLYLVIGLIPAGLGLIGPALMPNLEDPEQFLPSLAKESLHPFLYVLFAGALISAILSTVDSALLAASALLSHNILVPVLGNLTERKKLSLARVTTAAFGVIAYTLALFSGGIYELVETASAFGSSGVFVVVVFALFSKYGGPFTAAATLVVGCMTWLIGEFLLHLPYPYLISLFFAIATYLTIGIIERGRALEPIPQTEPETAPAT